MVRIHLQKSLLFLALVLVMMFALVVSALADPTTVGETPETAAPELGSEAKPQILTESASTADYEPCQQCQSCNSQEKREHPIMRPSLEELQRWLELRDSLPEAYIDPHICFQMEQWPAKYAESYSLLDHLQYTPTERDQGNCGNCWAWAGTGVMEIALDVQNGIKDRLSMQYLNSNFHGGSGSNWACCGGNLAYLANFYAGTRQAIPWSNTNASWQDGIQECDDKLTTVLADTISTTPNYPITSITAATISTHNVGETTAIRNIKNVLSQDKALYFTFYLANDSDWDNFHDFWDDEAESVIWNPDFSCGHTYDSDEGIGHAVLCVGYNDEDGEDNDYWIILNSWGTTTDRPNGRFHLDMHMNYDCQLEFLWYSDYNLDWRTLDITFVTEPPIVSTSPATSVGESDGQPTATLNGVITDDEGEPCQYRFEYDTDSGEPYTYNTTWTGGKITGEFFSENIPGLEEETTYYFRAQAKNIAGTGNGTELTFTTPKLFSVTLGASPDAVSLIIDGTTCSPADLPKLFSWANGSVHYCVVPSPVEASEGTQYVFTSWSDNDTSLSKTITVSGNSTYTASYKTQHYLTVDADYSDPSGEGWYDKGTDIDIETAEIIGDDGTRHVFLKWTVDDNTKTNNYVSITMDAPHMAVADYKTQHYLTVNSEYGDPEGQGWYDDGDMATFSVTSPLGSIVRKVFTKWSGDSTATSPSTTIQMDEPKTVTANWRDDYLFLYILIGGIVVVVGGGSAFIISTTRGRKPRHYRGTF